jgi:hypothetical protein
MKRGLRLSMVFWGLVLTAICYGIVMYSLSFYDPTRLPMVSVLRSQGTGLKMFMLLGVALLGLPKIVRAFRGTRALSSPLNRGAGGGCVALREKIIYYASGFETACVVGLLSYVLGFPVVWGVIGLVLGTICKCYYVPMFLKACREFRGRSTELPRAGGEGVKSSP